MRRTRRLSFNLALITKDNANPSEIAGVSCKISAWT